MITIGRRWPTSAPRGDYQRNCDYCGVTWRRSQLVRDGSGLYACPDDRAGRDVVTLSKGNAAQGHRYRAGRAGASGIYTGVTVTTTPSPNRTTGDHVELGATVPTYPAISTEVEVVLDSMEVVLDADNVVLA